MLEDNDITEIAQIMRDAIKRDITPKLDNLIAFQKKLPDKLNQETKIKELEHEITLLKKIIHKQSKDLKDLKRG